MFKSLTYGSYDPKTKQYLYELEDSEFGIVKRASTISPGRVEVGAGVAVGVVVAREYSKRYEDVAEHSYAKASDAYRQGLYAYVGKNLAVAAMWYSDEYKYSTEAICRWQDKYCPKYVPNWKEYAKSRDEYFERITLLK